MSSVPGSEPHVAAPRAGIAGVHTLAVVSHVVHYVHEGRIHAYGPYVRELDLWASLFPQLVIVSPVRHAPPPADTEPFSARNVLLRAFPESGGTSVAAKLWQVVCAPLLAWRLYQLLHHVHAVHVRCPGNVGLLGLLVAPLRARKLVAKYAGQWAGYAGEPVTVRWQRALLRSGWWRGPVTVYGREVHDPPHVVSFFTASFTDAQLRRAEQARALRAATPHQAARSPYRVLYVGRLSQAKRVDAVIDAVRLLPPTVVSACTVVGDGPERDALEQRAQPDADRVRFTGGLGLDDVLAEYERHDVLVLVSDTEGSPKVVTEAQAFGLRVITRETLAEVTGGPVATEQLAAAVAQCLASESWRAVPVAEPALPSLETLRQAVADLLHDAWER